MLEQSKKKSSEFLGVKMEIFFRKERRHSEIFVRENFFRPPQTRRQVSVTVYIYDF